MAVRRFAWSFLAIYLKMFRQGFFYKWHRLLCKGIMFLLNVWNRLNIGNMHIDYLYYLGMNYPAVTHNRHNEFLSKSSNLRYLWKCLKATYYEILSGNLYLLILNYYNNILHMEFHISLYYFFFFNFTYYSICLRIKISVKHNFLRIINSSIKWVL